MRRPTAVAAAVLLSICATSASPAVALERAGDALHAYALEAHARAESALEYEIAQTIDDLPKRDRFDLYRTSNRLTGTWSQVAFLQSLLDLSIGVESPSLEAELRTTLRAQTQFVLWELDHTIQDLARTAIEDARPEQARFAAAIHAFLADVMRTVTALDADARAQPQTAVEPLH